MMCKEKLMVGNLVRDKVGGVVGRVSEIKSRYVCLGDWLVDYDDIEPILIDVPTLHKNGFSWDGMYARYREDSMEIEYYKHEGIIREWYHHKNGSRELIAISRPGYRCLHDFQNWLTISGIEKQLTY